MRPHLIRSISSSDGSYKDTEFPTEIDRTVDIDPKILQFVKDAMIGVVQQPNGTGKRSRLDGVKATTRGPDGKKMEVVTLPAITVGGKTGTAQVLSLDRKSSRRDHEDHAWFTGFAPAEDPEIVVTALIEHGGGGGANAAPVVRKVLEAYFYRGAVIPELQTDLEPIDEQHNHEIPDLASLGEEVVMEEAD
jgi:penicillin-binding protein 2